MAAQLLSRRAVLRAVPTAGVGVGLSAVAGRSRATTQDSETRRAPFGEVATLSPSSRDPFQNFGAAVALAESTAVIGAYRGNSDEAGASVGTAEVYERRDGRWERRAELTAADAAAGALFGRSVALAGDTALVGAPNEATPAGSGAGAAYVFARANGDWSQRAKLAAGDGNEGDSFGSSVALDGDTALIGAPSDDGPNGPRAGAVYAFRRRDGAWRQQAELSPDGNAQRARFGSSVALAGDTALVGADGENAAYVFHREGAAWTERDRLLQAGDRGGRFGRAAALSGSGTTAVVGAQSANGPGGIASGSATVFVEDDGRWTRDATLAAADGDESDNFGRSVAVTDDVAVVGAWHDEDPNGPESGSAYVFERASDDWVQRQKLTASDGEEDDGFGSSVAATETTVIVGAGTADGAAGSASVFARGAAGTGGTPGDTASGRTPSDTETPADGGVGETAGTDGDSDGSGPGFGVVPSVLAVSLGVYRRYRRCDDG